MLFGRLLLAALHWFTRAPTFYQHAHDAANGWSAEAVQTFASILEVCAHSCPMRPIHLDGASSRLPHLALLAMPIPRDEDTHADSPHAFYCMLLSC